MTLIDKLYDFGKKAIILGTIITSSVPAYSETAQFRRKAYSPQTQQSYSQAAQIPSKQIQKKPVQLEKKVQRELMDDMFSWQDKQAEIQIKELYGEYKQILIKKQKFDSEKEKDLIENLNPTWDNIEGKIKKIKKTLLREKAPEEYLKLYVKDKKEKEKIKTFRLDEEYKTEIRRNNFRLWNLDIDNLDLSDKIFFYEMEKALEQLKKNPYLPGMSIGPLSGNSLF